MGQGRDQAKQFLREHPEIMKDLREKILTSKGIGQLLLTKDSEVGEEIEDLDDGEEGMSPSLGKKNKNSAKH